MRLLCILVALLNSGTIKANLISDWDVSLGSSTFNYQFGSELNESFETNSYIEFNYNLIHRGLDSALTFSFSEVLQGPTSYLPFTRFAIGGRYYFLGLNGERTIYETGISAQAFKATPFVGLNIGLSNLSVPGLNATFIDYALRGGVEIPLNSRILLLGQVGLGGDLVSSGNRSERVSYTTFDLFAGFRILPKF